MNIHINNQIIACEYKGDGHEYTFSSEEENVHLGSHEILVKVSACNVTKIPIDVMIDLFSKNPLFCHSPSTCIAGTVTETGSSVTFIKKNDRVVGLLPLDSSRSGCASYCILNDFDTVILPENVDFTLAAAVLGCGTKAFVALQYLAKINRGDVVLVFDASSAFGSLTVQLAKIWGAKVLAVTSYGEDTFFLENLTYPPDHILEADSSGSILNLVMKETGKLGANIIIDSGVKLFSNEEDSRSAKDDLSSWKPLKAEVISCLATGGHWVTSNPLLQIDPVDSLQLFLLGASVSYLFEHSWHLSPTIQGKWLHIARDLMTKLQNDSIKPKIGQIIPFKDFITTSSSIKKTDIIIISI